MWSPELGCALFLPVLNHAVGADDQPVGFEIEPAYVRMAKGRSENELATVLRPETRRASPLPSECGRTAPLPEPNAAATFALLSRQNALGSSLLTSSAGAQLTRFKAAVEHFWSTNLQRQFRKGCNFPQAVLLVPIIGDELIAAGQAEPKGYRIDKRASRDHSVSRVPAHHETPSSRVDNPRTKQEVEGFAGSRMDV